MNDEAQKNQQIAIADSRPLKNEIAMHGDGRRRYLAPENASQAMTFAQMMARSDAAVPDKFRNNPGLCLGVTMDAMTFGFNPFALARAAYVVSGAIGYEAKAYVASLNSSGFLKQRLRATYAGEIKGTHKVRSKTGEIEVPAGTLKCKIVGYIVGEEEPLEWETPELGSIKQKGSPLWISDPKLQLFYYAARAWARVHLPEVMLGIQTKDELEDIGEPDTPPTPKPTLIERVKARREEAGDAIAEALPPPPPSEQEPVVDVEPQEVSSEAMPAVPEPAPQDDHEASPPAEAAAPKPRRPRSKTKKDDDAPAAEEPAEAAAQIADEPGRPKTPEEALDMLRVAVGDAATREDVETAKLDWMLLITHFTRDEQFDLQSTGDEIAARRRIALSRKSADVGN